MRKLPTGTQVRALRDISPPIKDGAGKPFHVAAGETGKIVGVGPDAAFGWYPVAFDENRVMLMAVGPVAREPIVEVVE